MGAFVLWAQLNLQTMAQTQTIFVSPAVAYFFLTRAPSVVLPLIIVSIGVSRQDSITVTTSADSTIRITTGVA